MLNSLLIILFIISYSLIAFEQAIKINKAAISLFAGVLSWIFLFIFYKNVEFLNIKLLHHFSEITVILFFLLGAMTIVELIDAHNGFDIISNKLILVKPVYLIFIVSVISFILSAILDNLTTTILIISIVRKLLPESKLRLYFVGIIIIAANAGGVWSPIGDVTTSMLWIGGQVSSYKLITSLFLPSLINLVLPLLFVFLIIKKRKLFFKVNFMKQENLNTNNSGSFFILITGILIFISVPVLKVLFNLPPFMGILLGLGILWMITEIKNGRRDDLNKKNYSVAYALRNIDTPSILFFLGILLNISALESSGILSVFNLYLNSTFGNQHLILFFTGIASAIIDNVPLVAAFQGMYSKNYISDSSFWHLLAYCSGSGGSILIIGSAAGVVAMGIEKISFTWYLKYISALAFIGYCSGFLVYLILN